ncbi:hypothetical protein MVLG_04225 [Microbotryum lychnidis-dioicae p1A1 Lamole]|uniref:Phospholipase/carboxylesterase/thioesterase domain-containing protein n=1 Tax=Microbotryum lychnidis-dioicae (strain p1A1 Lamole / MvSl-1064) TaxID=683840 RepID=U5HAK0_USTV1|nr:hypothetical protein MVLG_04225 [Microbotryum lychnidis-dioicae p1A1 Lamole]|eukprot:KDE05430.1 hypothetical protein MVLG_04225 [Microbotryum lychnidis-dioicae p1A1 Lamole]
MRWSITRTGPNIPVLPPSIQAANVPTPMASRLDLPRSDSPGPHDNTKPLLYTSPKPSSSSSPKCVVIYLHGRGGSPEEDLPVFRPTFDKLNEEIAGSVEYPNHWDQPPISQEPYLTPALCLIDRTITSLSVPSNRVILAGFSQGASLALIYALSHPEKPLGGVLALSASIIDYVFNTKDPQYEEDPSVSARLQRLQNDFEQYGIRQTVEGVLLVHEHGHPHVLLLQVANAYFKLPGDYLKPNEPNKDGLGLRLDMRLGPKARDDAQSDPSMEKKQVTGWEVHDLLAQWWRPNYEQFMYPYVPAHIAQPKEVKSLYLVQLPEHKVFTVPSNMKLIAIPLLELYDNAVRYGPLLAAVPHLLSKYRFEIG